MKIRFRKIPNDPWDQPVDDPGLSQSKSGRIVSWGVRIWRTATNPLVRWIFGKAFGRAWSKILTTIQNTLPLIYRQVMKDDPYIPTPEVEARIVAYLKKQWPQIPTQDLLELAKVYVASQPKKKIAKKKTKKKKKKGR